MSAILHNYALGARVNTNDAALLHDLLLNHPDAESKIGCGVASFEIRRNPMVPTQPCFYIRRIDGTWTDFSYLKCISHPTARAIFRSICRHLVISQVIRYKNMFFEMHQRTDGRVECPVTGQWITRDQAHVDHVPPDTFEQLVSDFIGLYQVKVQHVELCETTDERMIGKTFADERLVELWKSYHESNATLRVVSIYANTYLIPAQVRLAKKHNKGG